MSGSARGNDDRTVEQRPATAPVTADRATALECIVVRYQNRPDRCTFAPRECSDAARLTTWLSVDATAVVDLEEVR